MAGEDVTGAELARMEMAGTPGFGLERRGWKGLGDMEQQVKSQAKCMMDELDELRHETRLPREQAISLMIVKALRDVAHVLASTRNRVNYSEFVRNVVLKDGTRIADGHASMVGNEVVITTQVVGGGKRVIPFAMVESMEEISHQQMMDEGVKAFAGRTTP